MRRGIFHPLYSGLIFATTVSGCGNADERGSGPAPTVTVTVPAEVRSIGVKDDQRGLGWKDPSTYRYAGLDVDIATAVAMRAWRIDSLTFVPVSSDTRERTLDSGGIRFFAATYTMTPERADKYLLAGPYLYTTQGVMVRKSGPGSDISKPGDLKGVRTCTVAGDSKGEEVLKKFAPDAISVPAPDYSECLRRLTEKDPEVDAFSADLPILYGYLNNAGTAKKVRVIKRSISGTFSYALAFRKNDLALCEQARDALLAMLSSKQWDESFVQNLGMYAHDYSATWQTSIKPTADAVRSESCH